MEATTTTPTRQQEEAEVLPQTTTATTATTAESRLRQHSNRYAREFLLTCRNKVLVSPLGVE